MIVFQLSSYLSSCNRLLAEELGQKMPAGQEPVKIQVCESHSASGSYEALWCQMGPEVEEPAFPLLLLLNLKDKSFHCKYLPTPGFFCVFGQILIIFLLILFLMQ